MDALLVSEIQKWHWAISWDNPVPADSSAMLAALSALGKLTKLQTKTTVILAPRGNVPVSSIRKAISSNLHPTKGNAFYANLRTGNIFEWGSNTGHKWHKAN